MSAPSAQELQDEWEALFGDKPPYERARTRALSGELKSSPLRVLSWKLFLGVLSPGASPKEWAEQMQKARAMYNELQQTYTIDPHSSKEKDLDPTVDNPLSQSAESRWNVYFENNELQRMINQDIVRTYPEVPFFHKLHPSVSYKQGMHELLAPFIFLLDRHKLPHAEADANHIAFLCSDKFIEHDAFALFSALMQTTGVWFHSDPPPKAASKSGSGSEIGSTNRESSRPTSPLPRSDSSGEDVSHSPIVKRCRYIQFQLLKEKDPQLQSYLDAMSIEPQLYALRWLRLLMGREFELEDLLQLWDALFAHSADLKLIDYLAVAMLIFMRSHLVGHDYNRCMKRLFKFPPVDDVSPFVQTALRMYNEDNTPKKDSPPPAAAVAPTPKPAAATASSSAASSATSKAQSATSLFRQKTVARVASSLSNLWYAEDRRQQDMMQSEINRLKTRDVHMAQRIERIIYSLLKELQYDVSNLRNIQNSSPVQTPEPAMDAVLVAIAELKQVKDILNGLLHDDAPSHLPPAASAPAVIIPSAAAASVTGTSPPSAAHAADKK